MNINRDYVSLETKFCYVCVFLIVARIRLFLQTGERRLACAPVHSPTAGIEKMDLLEWSANLFLISQTVVKSGIHRL